MQLVLIINDSSFWTALSKLNLFLVVVKYTETLNIYVATYLDCFFLLLFPIV